MRRRSAESSQWSRPSLAVVLLQCLHRCGAGDDDRCERPTITATVTLPPRHSGGNEHPAPGSPDTGAAFVCVSTPSPASAELVDRFNSLAPPRRRSGFEHHPDPLLLRAELAPSLQRRHAVASSDSFASPAPIPNDPQNSRLRWQVTSPPDPAILLPGATRTATEQIGVPHPAISPTGDVAINLGMWLAVEQAGPYVARAAFNDAIWAETTATLATTTFDFGDGTPPIVCDGIGTPIPTRPARQPRTRTVRPRLHRPRRRSARTR